MYALEGQDIKLLNEVCQNLENGLPVAADGWASVSRLIEKNRQLILEMNNLFGGGANQVFFTLTGRRIYDDQYREIV